MAGSPLMLPGALANLLNELGYIWPKSDEVKMFELGGKWMEFGGEVREVQGEATPHMQNVVQKNMDDAIEAFKKIWTDKDAASELTKDGGTGALVVGACLFVAAGLVLALKIAVIVQLTILIIEIAQAIATAVPTFGASLLEIPVFKKLADMAINLIISRVVEAILS